MAKTYYNFSSLAIDPDGDSVSIRFDWGNGDTSDWSELIPTEQTISMSYSWLSLGTYNIKVQAKDNNENISEWSLPNYIKIEVNVSNQPPVPLIPLGPSYGDYTTDYEFAGSAIDPEDDSIAIRLDWGDGDTSDWSAWITSSDSIWMSHRWLYPDTYYVRTQAKDNFGAISTWSEAHSIIIGSVDWVCLTHSAAWEPRESHASVVFDNKIWVIGGHMCSDEVWSSPDGENWTCVTNSAGFGERDDHRAVVFDDKIWVIAGSHNNPRNDVWFSSDGAYWVCVTNSAPWSPRWDHSAVVFDNKIWVLGGQSFNEYYRDVWYSADGINWVRATDSAKCVSRPNHTAVVFNNKIWVMGGQIPNTNYGSNEIWYSANGKDWFKALSSAPWARRHWHTSFVFENKIWVIGGKLDGIIGDCLNDVWYSPDGVSWFCEIPRTPFLKRCDHTAVVFKNMIWLLGGKQLGAVYLNDVWFRVMIYGK